MPPRPHLHRHRLQAAAHAEHFVLGAVPLNRTPIVELLSSSRSTAAGAPITVMGQRPSTAAEEAWLADLYRPDTASTPPPTVDDLLAIDDPVLHLRTTTTDRLVPASLLDQPGFLTRNLGGWAPVYLDVFGLPAERPADPVLDNLEALVTYGDEIDAIGADAALVRQRLHVEIGGDEALAARMLVTAGDHRRDRDPDEAVSMLLGLLRRSQSGAAGTRVAPAVVFDALLSVLTAVEDRRRHLLLLGDERGARKLVELQEGWRDVHGLTFILKGEYIAGRHRRSTVLIAPQYSAVVKQPAPEPLHDIRVGDRIVEGRSENWPYPVDNGALVTPRGRLRMMLEDGAFPRLARAFAYPVHFCTLLGIHIEPFVAGDTLQKAALADPAIVTPGLYDEIVLHQQVCEVLGVDNADWHAANFMVRTDAGPRGSRAGGAAAGDRPGRLVHVDWAAARSFTDAERTGASGDGARARLEQVRNLAYSFHDEGLAARINDLHERLVGEPSALEAIRRRAQALVAGRGGRE